MKMNWDNIIGLVLIALVWIAVMFILFAINVTLGGAFVKLSVLLLGGLIGWKITTFFIR